MSGHTVPLVFNIAWLPLGRELIASIFKVSFPILSPLEYQFRLNVERRLKHLVKSLNSRWHEYISKNSSCGRMIIQLTNRNVDFKSKCVSILDQRGYVHREITSTSDFNIRSLSNRVFIWMNYEFDPPSDTYFVTTTNQLESYLNTFIPLTNFTNLRLMYRIDFNLGRLSNSKTQWLDLLQSGFSSKYNLNELDGYKLFMAHLESQEDGVVLPKNLCVREIPFSVLLTPELLSILKNKGNSDNVRVIELPMSLLTNSEKVLQVTGGNLLGFTNQQFGLYSFSVVTILPSWRDFCMWDTLRITLQALRIRINFKNFVSFFIPNGVIQDLRLGKCDVESNNEYLMSAINVNADVSNAIQLIRRFSIPYEVISITPAFYSMESSKFALSILSQSTFSQLYICGSKGSGKTVFAKNFPDDGTYVIDSDTVGRILLNYAAAPRDTVALKDVISDYLLVPFDVRSSMASIFEKIASEIVREYRQQNDLMCIIDGTLHYGSLIKRFDSDKTKLSLLFQRQYDEVFRLLNISNDTIHSTYLRLLQENVSYSDDIGHSGGRNSKRAVIFCHSIPEIATMSSGVAIQISQFGNRILPLVLRTFSTDVPFSDVSINEFLISKVLSDYYYYVSAVGIPECEFGVLRLLIREIT